MINFPKPEKTEFYEIMGGPCPACGSGSFYVQHNQSGDVCCCMSPDPTCPACLRKEVLVWRLLLSAAHAHAEHPQAFHDFMLACVEKKLFDMTQQKDAMSESFSFRPGMHGHHFSLALGKDGKLFPAYRSKRFRFGPEYMPKAAAVRWLVDAFLADAAEIYGAAV